MRGGGGKDSHARHTSTFFPVPHSQAHINSCPMYGIAGLTSHYIVVFNNSNKTKLRLHWYGGATLLLPGQVLWK
jgi:hypothetical protein